MTATPVPRTVTVDLSLEAAVEVAARYDKHTDDRVTVVSA